MGAARCRSRHSGVRPGPGAGRGGSGCRRRPAPARTDPADAGEGRRRLELGDRDARRHPQDLRAGRRPSPLEPREARHPARLDPRVGRGRPAARGLSPGGADPTREGRRPGRGSGGPRRRRSARDRRVLPAALPPLFREGGSEVSRSELELRSAADSRPQRDRFRPRRADQEPTARGGGARAAGPLVVREGACRARPVSRARREGGMAVRLAGTGAQARREGPAGRGAAAASRGDGRPLEAAAGQRRTTTRPWPRRSRTSRRGTA